jgi:trehalose 6-phosphate phosphatase
MRDPSLEAEMMSDRQGFALFLDFDGTLVDIAERPDEVRVDPALPPALDRLQQRLDGALALVSGRPIAFLDQRFSPFRFDAAGLHGIEHRLAGRLSPCNPDDHPVLRAEVARLVEATIAHPGLLIEDKGCSVAVHWRIVPHLAEFARTLAQRAADALGADYRIQYGKAVAEILPAASGKGRVIETFLREAPYRGRTPIFIGDDLTDEQGFEAVNAAGGLSVRIGAGETAARQRLETPAMLREKLLSWAKTGEVSLA